MDRPEIRLIVMDMDGTLLNDDQQVSSVNADALLRARGQGVRLAVCSGRCFGDIAMFAASYGLEDCAILSLNGAYCALDASCAPYANHVMPQELFRTCVALLKPFDPSYACFAQNTIVSVASRGETRKLEWSSYTQGRYAPVILRGAQALDELTEVNKLVYLDADAQRLSRMKSTFEGLDGLDVTSSWEDNLELMPHGVSKGAAVAELAEKLGIPLASVMTLGDNENDLSMIACDCFGVAMGNATDSVKRAARYVTKTNEEDGVAYAIERFVLKHERLL